MSKWSIIEDMYLFKTSPVTTGGSSYIFKGFTISSLKNKLGDDISESILRDIKSDDVKSSTTFSTDTSNKILRYFLKQGISSSDPSLYDLDLDFVAIKILRSYLLNTEFNSLWEKEANFNIEHENLGQVRQYYSYIVLQKGRPKGSCIILDWLNGGVLKPSYFKGKSFIELRSVFSQVLDAVDAIHKNKQIHLDLKPNNIMFHNNYIKLVDFSLLENIKGKYAKQNRYYGTPEYSSPEQIGGNNLSYDSDIWSLGVILYELVFGKEPFYSDKVVRLKNKQDEYKKKKSSGNLIANRERLENIEDEIKQEIIYQIQLGDIELDSNKVQLDNDGPDFEKEFQIHKKVISKCLKDSRRAKDQNRRYDSISELKEDYMLLQTPTVTSNWKEYTPYILIIIFLLIAMYLFI